MGNKPGRKVLVGITTSPFSGWKRKIAEVDEYGLDEISFFPTFLELEERKEAYDLLKKTKLKKITHVHIRDDMEEWELDFFVNDYKAQAFNTHPGQRFHNLVKKNDKYKNIIYIENLYRHEENLQFSDKFIKENDIAGICLDFTHLERERLTNKDEYERKMKLINENFIGCNHVGAIAEKPRIEKIDGKVKYDQHMLEKMSELNYLEKYPLKYFSKYVSIEMDNPLSQLLEAKKYIEKIIRKKEKDE